VFTLFNRSAKLSASSLDELDVTVDLILKALFFSISDLGASIDLKETG